MKHLWTGILATWVAFSRPAEAIQITTTSDLQELITALFDNDPGITFNVQNSAIAAGAAGLSVGTFTEGPFGIGSGIILTTGDAEQATLGVDLDIDNESTLDWRPFCGPDSTNWVVLSLSMDNTAYTAIRIDFIFASEERGAHADPIFFGLSSNQANTAKDADGNLINAKSPLLASPIAILPPDSDTAYASSSPPLVYSMPIRMGNDDLGIFICDYDTVLADSALMVKMRGCIDDCPQSFHINYVTTTTTVGVGEQPYTSTIKAQGTTSGTVIIGARNTNTPTSSTTTTTTTTVATTPGFTPTETPSSTTSSTTSSTSMTDTSSTSSTTKTTSTTRSTEATSTIQPTSTTRPTTGTTSATTTGVSSATDGAPGTELETKRTSTTTQGSVSTEPAMATSQESSAQGAEPPGSTSTDTTVQLGTGSEATVASTTSSAIQSSNPDTAIIQSSNSDTGVMQPSNSNAETDALAISTPGPSNDDTTTPAASPTTTPPQASTASTSAEESATASNLAQIGLYFYIGCLGSEQGYPTFTEVTTDDEMTPELCIELAGDSRYVGLFNRACYVAETLDSATLVPDGQCDIPCPGDAGLFCGGFVFSSGQRRSEVSFRRRDAPPDILMTLYGRAGDGAESSSDTVLIPTTASAQASAQTLAPLSSSSAMVAPGEDDVVTSSGSGEMTETVTEPDSTYDLTQTVTDAELATTVSTVFYSTVDSANPSRLVATQVHITLIYAPCPVCANHGVPLIEMTTVTAHCSACGRNGESDVTLTVPKTDCSACAHPVQGDSATAGQPTGESVVQTQPHPTAGSQNTEAFPTMPPGGPFANWMHEIVQFSTMGDTNTHQISASSGDESNLPASAGPEPPGSGSQQPSTAANDNPASSAAQHVQTLALQHLSGSSGYRPQGAQGSKTQQEAVSVVNTRTNAPGGHTNVPEGSSNVPEDQTGGSSDASLLSASPATATQAASVWGFGLSTHPTVDMPLTTPSMPVVVTAKGARLPRPEVYLVGAVIVLFISFVL